MTEQCKFPTNEKVETKIKFHSALKKELRIYIAQQNESGKIQIVDLPVSVLLNELIKAKVLH